MAVKKPKGLGLGLEVLLGPTVQDGDAAQASPHRLRTDQLRPGKYQPRTRMDEGALHELAESIRTQGVMQPVLVRPLPLPSGNGALAAETTYEIIAGERRVRAARLAGLDEVPVLVRDVPDEAAAVMSLIENIQREDLNALEEAQGLKRLVAEFGLTHDQAAQAVGRSRSAASNLLRLLQLTEPVQRSLMAGELEMGHARALLGLEAARQVLVAQEVIAKQLSVRDTEKLVARTAGTRPQTVRSAATPPPKSRDITRLEEQLADMLGAPVDIRLRPKGRGKAQGGEVVIGFGTLDALSGLLSRLGIVEQ